MDKWQTIDWIALIVTLVVSFILIYATISGDKMSEQGVEIYSEVIISYISVLLIYVGYRLKK